jgi:hypothetical protein
MARGFEILNNDFADTERAVLADIHGIEKADEIIAEANSYNDEFDAEVQEILDDVLPLDEI